MKTICLLLFAFAVALAAPGCRPAPSTEAPPPVSSDPRSKIPKGLAPVIDRADAMIDLKEIGTYYQLHQADGLAARDLVLKDVQHDDAKLYRAIQAGQYVLLNGDPARDASAVIAYEKDAPTKGGIVLPLDFVPRHMNADEFKAAPKPGQ